MARRTELLCPCCGGLQLSVRTCKEVKIVCRVCGASLLFTKNEDESIVLSIRPKADKAG